LTIPANSVVTVRADKRFLREPLSSDVKNVITGNGRNPAVELSLSGRTRRPGRPL